jgi:sialidase-1
MTIARQRIPVVLYFLSVAAMWIFVGLFVWRNWAGLENPWITGLLGLAYVLLYGTARSYFTGLPGFLRRPLYLIALMVLPWVFIQGTLWDYYQPLSLFDDVILALAVSWLLLIAGLLIELWRGERDLSGAAAIALLGPLLVQGLVMVNKPLPSDALAHHSDLFVGGEGGYDTYRIPALLVLPPASRLASGETLKADRILALVEARKDSALDTGVIDLVLKHSDNGGASWSAQRVICRHVVGDERGKCGNATPVFDADTGRIWLAYNLSGIPGDLPEGPRPHSAHLMASDDGGLSWGEPMRLPFDDVVFGPGHGIQKELPPARGRLVIPGNRGGTSLAVYSDDHGLTWQEGAALGAGNENEIVELSDGRLYMATRHVAPTGRPPQPNGRLYAISTDGGSHWEKPQLDESLPTPISQASILGVGEGGQLLFSNPAHHKARVRMTVRTSLDDGASWPGELLVYPGPAGYSQLGVLSGGDVLVLYERGRMAYSEMISFARIPAAQLPR